MGAAQQALLFGDLASATVRQSDSPKRPTVRILDSRDTLADARTRVLEQLADGSDCPCCGQLARSYNRPLNATMAACLLWLVRSWTADPRWHDIHEHALISKSGGDFAKMAHWRLIEQAIAPSGDKRTSGAWRPTQRGCEFARGAITVPSHVILYDNKVQGWSEDHVDIHAALGRKFSYRELLHGE